ncbi:MAG: hypothetical protein II938_03425 [Alphaproteobacteria bacterium]|nr:hypothetical protein [Alphaproteobacteria bacterium]
MKNFLIKSFKFLQVFYLVGLMLFVAWMFYTVSTNIAYPRLPHNWEMGASIFILIAVCYWVLVEIHWITKKYMISLNTVKSTVLSVWITCMFLAIFLGVILVLALAEHGGVDIISIYFAWQLITLIMGIAGIWLAPIVLFYVVKYLYKKWNQRRRK